MTGECYVLFNEGDLNKHFILLNQTRINQNEIEQMWRAIKDIVKQKAHMSSSALEIARQAGWDDSVKEIETRVITAIAALEAAGFVKRGKIIQAFMLIAYRLNLFIDGGRLKTFAGQGARFSGFL